MDLLIAFLVFLGALVASLVWNFSMLIPLSIGLLAFVAVGRRRGFSLQALGGMAVDGAKSSFVVLRVFVLIGLITALWRSGGIIAFFVYHGIELITPSLFLLIAFLLTSLLAYALGTSFGIIGTVGIILMAVARSGGVSEILTAGAVMSGAYFGDRSAPTASSAHLVAAVTKTKLFDNVKWMLKTGALPYLIALGVYALLSVQNPIAAIDRALLEEISQTFTLSLWLLLPAGLMLILPLCKVEVRNAMLISILSTFLITVFVQGQSVWQTLYICIFGYHPQGGGLAQILAGGGLISMLSVSGIVLLSCTYVGIFQGTRMLDKVLGQVERLCQKIGLYPAMLLVSTAVTAVFCNQTIGVVLSNQLMEQSYKTRDAHGRELAIDLENSVIVIAGVIPWSIACAVPLSMLGVGAEAVLYSVYLYAVPLCYLVTKRFFFKKGDKKARPVS